MLHRREFHRTLAAAGAAGLSASLLAGCTTRTEIVPEDGGDVVATGDITIGMIAKSQSNPVFQAARKGAEARATELSSSLGVKVAIDWRTPNDEDAQRQAEFIEQLAGGGAQAITIACSDASKVTRAIDDAIARRLTVMCFDSDAPDSKRLCYVGTDDYSAGQQVMAKTAELLGDREGVIAILAGNQTATNLQKRVLGAQDELAKHSNLTLKEVYYHKETPQDAYRQVEDVQKANPEINGWAMIGGWPLMVETPLPWVAGEVICVSMDTLPPQLEHLRIGDVQALLGQQYFYFGGQCVSILVDKVREGKDPAKIIDFAPLDLVTAENVDEYAKNWEKWS
jgi:ribose transport system substrate-binding protein